MCNPDSTVEVENETGAHGFGEIHTPIRRLVSSYVLDDAVPERTIVTDTHSIVNSLTKPKLFC